jgi:hypothetical protein
MRKVPPLVQVDTTTGEVEWFDELPDDVQFVVVIPLTVPLAYPDNLLGVCSACGRAVQFRPATAPAPIKLCVPCVPAWVEGLEKTT